MVDGQPRFQIDPLHGGYTSSLQTALDTSPQVEATSLCGLDDGWQLVVDRQGTLQQADEGHWLGLADRWFGNASMPVESGELEAITLIRQTILFREAENLLVRRCDNARDQALLITVSNTLPASAATALSRRLSSGIGEADLQTKLAGAGDVLAGALLRVDDGELLVTYQRADNASGIILNAALSAVLAQALRGESPAQGDSLISQLAGSMERVSAVELEDDGRVWSLSAVPMAPGYAVGLQYSAMVARDLARRIQRELQNDVLRDAIGALLEGGLRTQVAPFPQNDQQFLQIVSELRALDEDDLLGRLDIGGFAPHGFGEGVDRQQCKECIYYLPHRKWCDIPELPLPVEAHWWCRLWKL